MTKQQLEQELTKAKEEIDVLKKQIEAEQDRYWVLDRQSTTDIELAKLQGQVEVFNRIFALVDRYLEGRNETEV